MSAARYALLNLQESPPHVKNWRPQILLFLKCTQHHEGNQLSELKKQMSDSEGQKDDEDNDNFGYNINVQHPKAFALVHQLKAGKGLVVCTSVVLGDFIENKTLGKAVKQVIITTMTRSSDLLCINLILIFFYKTLEKTMAHFKAKGFCETLVSQNVDEGISHL